MRFLCYFFSEEISEYIIFNSYHVQHAPSIPSLIYLAPSIPPLVPEERTQELHAAQGVSTETLEVMIQHEEILP